MPATSSMISASLATISFYADQTTSVLQIDAWKSFILLDACQDSTSGPSSRRRERQVKL
jgi:hypothetical protein